MLAVGFQPTDVLSPCFRRGATVDGRTGHRRFAREAGKSCVAKRLLPSKRKPWVETHGYHRDVAPRRCPSDLHRQPPEKTCNIRASRCYVRFEKILICSAVFCISFSVSSV